jgi:hypothetical protein
MVTFMPQRTPMPGGPSIVVDLTATLWIIDSPIRRRYVTSVSFTVEKMGLATPAVHLDTDHTEKVTRSPANMVGGRSRTGWSVALSHLLAAEPLLTLSLYQLDLSSTQAQV